MFRSVGYAGSGQLVSNGRANQMHRTAAIAILAFSHVAFSQTCTVTEKLMAGAWERSGRAGYFEQMEFTSEAGANVFNSWLHERPEILNATWSLAECTLRISTPESTFPEFIYKLRMKGKNTLELKASGESAASYRRLKSTP
jgi:hypothetical protein